MERIIIKPGVVLVKKDGIIYELDKKTFQTIKALIFDIDYDLCKSCRKTMCKEFKQIDDDYITDALTLKTKKICAHVFGCEHNEPKGVDCDGPRLVFFNPDSPDNPDSTVFEDMDEKEKTIRHYSDVHVRHIAHPTVARHIDKIK